MRVFAVTVAAFAPVRGRFPSASSPKAVLVTVFATQAMAFECFAAARVLVLEAFCQAFACVLVAFSAPVFVALATVLVLPESAFAPAGAPRIPVVAVFVFVCQAYSCVIRAFSPPAWVTVFLVTVFVHLTTAFPSALVVHCQVF